MTGRELIKKIRECNLYDHEITMRDWRGDNPVMFKVVEIGDIEIKNKRATLEIREVKE